MMSEPRTTSARSKQGTVMSDTVKIGTLTQTVDGIAHRLPRRQ
jgi:hypothetical protein